MNHREEMAQGTENEEEVSFFRNNNLLPQASGKIKVCFDSNLLSRKQGFLVAFSFVLSVGQFSLCICSFVWFRF